MTANSTAASPLEALKAGFRRACVRRLVGDEQGAIVVLKDEIPKLVVGWAKTSNLDPGEKKAKLKEMFDDESARADELATAFDLFAGRFETRLAGLMREELSDMVQKVEALVRQIPPSPTKEVLPGIDSGEGFPAKKAKSISKADTKQDPEKAPEMSSETEKDQEISMEQVEVAMGKKVDKEVDETKEQDLDPPRGIGLKFDEIENMIDEVLSSGI